MNAIQEIERLLDIRAGLPIEANRIGFQEMCRFTLPAANATAALRKLLAVAKAAAELCAFTPCDIDTGTGREAYDALEAALQAAKEDK